MAQLGMVFGIDRLLVKSHFLGSILIIIEPRHVISNNVAF